MALQQEQNALGQLLFLGDRIDVEDYHPQDFALKNHRTIFRAIRDSRRLGQIPAIFTVELWLIKRGLLQEVGGAEYLVWLANFTKTHWAY